MRMGIKKDRKEAGELKNRSHEQMERKEKTEIKRKEENEVRKGDRQATLTSEDECVR